MENANLLILLVLDVECTKTACLRMITSVFRSVLKVSLTASTFDRAVGKRIRLSPVRESITSLDFTAVLLGEGDAEKKKKTID